MKSESRARYVRRIKAGLREHQVIKARIERIPVRVLRLSEYLLYEVVCAEIVLLEQELATLELEGLKDEP